MTSRRHLTRALMIAALAVGAWTASELAHHDTAHAGDTPAAVVTERPGGPLGDLPATAADTAQDAVDTVLPDPLIEPKPPEHAEPEHSTEPTQAPEPEDEPAEEPADEPVTDDRPRDPEPTPTTPPVVIDLPPIVVDVPPVVVDVPPVEVTTPPPPVVLPTPPPVVAPTPTPEQPSSPLPVEVDLPTAPALPAAPKLPVAIGPTATPAQLADDGVYPPGVLPEPAPAADCDSPNRQANGKPVRSGDGKQQQRGDRDDPPDTATKRPRPGKPGPGDDGRAIANSLLTAAATVYTPDRRPPLVTITTSSGIGDTTLTASLRQLRARSTIPVGREEHPEPGPA